MQILNFIVLLSTVSAMVLVTDEDRQVLVSRPEIIDAVNAKKTTWKAGVNIKFATATVADAKRMMGTILPGDKEYIAPELTRTSFPAAVLPDSFDSRTQWANCANIIGHVRDQSACGSCWAFGSTEAFNDRHCIATGDNKTFFAPEDTNDCCSGLSCGGSNGCNGGQPSGAWNWFQKTGVSTGGDYPDVGKGTSCKPYSLPSCAHHVTPPPGVTACPSTEYRTPKCASTCSETGYNTTTYAKDKFFAKSSYSLRNAVDMQNDILANGPITVSMTVYEDFESYVSGVYHHVTGSNLGGHSIKIIGWGVDGTTPYWLVVNSWNTYWGESGLFRIVRGTNECGIEGSAIGGTV